MRKTPENAAAENAAIWATAKRLGEFSYHSLSAEARITVERSTALVRGWQRTRLAVFDRVGERGRKIFRLRPDAEQIDLPANLIVQPSVESADENMWRSARMLTSFGPLDLAFHSTTPSVTVTEDMAMRFCQMLLKGGYLKVVRKAVVKRSRGSLIRTPAVYRLVKNNGPIPPIERRVTVVFDANIGEYTYVAGMTA